MPMKPSSGASSTTLPLAAAPEGKSRATRPQVNNGLTGQYARDNKGVAGQPASTGEASATARPPGREPVAGAGLADPRTSAMPRRWDPRCTLPHRAGRTGRVDTAGSRGPPRHQAAAALAAVLGGQVRAERRRRVSRPAADPRAGVRRITAVGAAIGLGSPAVARRRRSSSATSGGGRASCRSRSSCTRSPPPTRGSPSTEEQLALLGEVVRSTGSPWRASDARCSTRCVASPALPRDGQRDRDGGGCTAVSMQLFCHVRQPARSARPGCRSSATSCARRGDSRASQECREVRRRAARCRAPCRCSTAGVRPRRRPHRPTRFHRRDRPRRRVPGAAGRPGPSASPLMTSSGRRSAAITAGEVVQVVGGELADRQPTSTARSSASAPRRFPLAASRARTLAAAAWRQRAQSVTPTPAAGCGDRSSIQSRGEPGDRRSDGSRSA